MREVIRGSLSVSQGATQLEQRSQPTGMSTRGDEEEHSTVCNEQTQEEPASRGEQEYVWAKRALEAHGRHCQHQGAALSCLAADWEAAWRGVHGVWRRLERALPRLVRAGESGLGGGGVIVPANRSTTYPASTERHGQTEAGQSAS